MLIDFIENITQKSQLINQFSELFFSKDHPLYTFGVPTPMVIRSVILIDRRKITVVESASSHIKTMLNSLNLVLKFRIVVR